MEKVKVHRSQPALDMTPMVDLAFLLVTFFMLTTKFAPKEPLAVDMPSSVSEIKIPDTDILTISISKEGIIFFNMDGKYNREALLKKMGEQYSLSFTPEEIQRFGMMSSLGVPMGNLKTLLSLDAEQQKKVHQPGIPASESNNELADWIMYARITNPRLRIAIKGDRDVHYPVVKQVMETLIDRKVNRFNLITNMEKGSS